MHNHLAIAAAALMLISPSVAGAADGAHVAGYVLVALNPQPEPPGITEVTAYAPVVKSNPVGRVALNPQPEPPGITADARKLPPGPCRTLRVTVTAGASTVSELAKPTPVAGKCAFDLAVPGTTLGARAAVKFSRDSLR
jgi:hypothetical protein